MHLLGPPLAPPTASPENGATYQHKGDKRYNLPQRTDPNSADILGTALTRYIYLYIPPLRRVHARMVERAGVNGFDCSLLSHSPGTISQAASLIYVLY